MNLKLEQLNDNLICKLCNGYLINCVTIVECLHTFCKSCLIKYLESDKKCPKCNQKLNYSKEEDLLKFDFKIQKLVYKIIPSIFLNEKERRTKFYQDHPEDEINNELNLFKDDNLIWNLNDLINIKLEYLPNKTDQLTDDLNTSIAKLRYLQVEAAMDILHLKKWIKNKYDLSFNHKVIVLFKNEILIDSLKMIDLAYILSEKNCPLNLYFYYYEISSGNKKKNIKRKLSNKKLKLKKLKISNDLIDCKNINDNKILNGKLNNTNDKNNDTNGNLNGSNKKINGNIKLNNLKQNNKSIKIKNQINKKSKLLNPLVNQTKQIENNQAKLNTIKVNKLSKVITKKRKLN